MKLYEIDNVIASILDEISNAIDEDGQIIDENLLIKLEQELNVFTMAKNDKIENVGLMYKNIQAEAEAVKREKGNFAKRQKALENKAEWLKKYLAGSLQGEKFKTEKIVISYRKSTSLNLEVEAINLDDEYRDVRYTPKKDVIKKAIQSGVEIDGASIIEKQNIQIK